MPWENLAEDIREEFAGHETAEMESPFVLQLLADRKAKAEAKAKTPRKYKPAALKRVEEEANRELEKRLQKRRRQRLCMKVQRERAKVDPEEKARLDAIRAKSLAKQKAALEVDPEKAEEFKKRHRQRNYRWRKANPEKYQEQKRRNRERKRVQEETTMTPQDPRLELLLSFCRIFERLLPPLEPAPAPTPTPPPPAVRKVAPASTAPKVTPKKKSKPSKPALVPDSALGSRLIEVVAGHFSLSKQNALSSKKPEHREARGILWYLLQDTAGYHQSAVAKISGLSVDAVRDWTRVIEKRRQEEPDLQRLLSELRQRAERGA